jgi:TRAP-type mannitol/chloroaromatic compound transport system permease small subunit
MELPATGFSRAVAPLLNAVERVTGWLWLVLLAIIILNVSARQLLGEGFVQFEELQWHLYAAGFLFGIACACNRDAHVRVDVLREGWSPRTRAWIDLYGILVLLVPFILLVIVYGIPFAYSSFMSGEISQSPGGLPWRWIPKALLPLSFVVLLLAAVARLTQVAAFLFRHPHPTGGEQNAR